uniref:MTLa1 n=1 Tax=Candida orthopsilosis TaxID=273371 RepID=F1D922_9ASCO|nr:MTLa1 [Candida orthopsilosis]
MNSEYYEGKALLDSLTVLEELTNTTTLVRSTTEQGNSDTMDNPRQLVQDLKENCNSIDPRLEWGLEQLPSNLRSIELFEKEDIVPIPLQFNTKFLLRRVSISVGNSMTEKLTLQDTYLCGSWNSLKTPRQRLSLSSKELLERIFLVKQFPNRRERELIAKKCGVSPLQIRVWFTNKRMRSKTVRVECGATIMEVPLDEVQKH